MTFGFEHLLIVHAGVTWFMAGLIWFVQIVHYPLMAEVGPDCRVRYELLHKTRTTWVVGPAMLLESVTAVLIILLAPSPFSPWHTAIAWMALGMLAAIWLSTFIIQVPLHVRLSREFDPALHRRLVITNWLRTALWTGRAVLVGLMLT